VKKRISKQSINAESPQLEVVQAASNNEVKCPRCESNNYWKRGFNAKGEQKYTCKECNHCFYLNAQWKILERDNRIVCSECGSNHYFKRGTTAQGKQQYSCADCNRWFTKEPIDPDTIVCPRCGVSDYYWKRGFTEQGEQRYRCKECNHGFYLNTQWKILERDNRIVCPECGSNHYFKRGTTAQGKQQYSCADCNRFFITDHDEKPLFDAEGNEIVCLHCGSQDYKKSGTSGSINIKQQYKCAACGKCYVLNPKNKLAVTNEFDFHHDVWTAEQLGIEIRKHKSGNKLNFFPIQQKWLKKNTKKFILYRSTHREFGTLQGYLYTFKIFSIFLSTIGYEEDIENINRSLIIDFLSYFNRQNPSYGVTVHILSDLGTFFDLGKLNNWFEVQPCLIRPEDYPKKPKRLPRYIPEEVMQQLNQHLDRLPESVMRMVLVIQECGFRVGELCQLKFDCLKSDGKGGGFIQYMMWKMNKEDTKPISEELAKVIQEQQRYIQENLGAEFEYLFCGRGKGVWKEFIPQPEVMKSQAFINHLKRLADKCDIKDTSGKRWNFQSHQFRHTVGTRMINNGVPQHIVQRYLGHESPEMTMVYAHIHDETLRKEIEKYHETRVVNFQGEAAELEETVLSSGDDLDWFKKTVQARALEHGYCARPKLLGDCDIPGFDGCYNCPHWRTNKNFLPVLKDTLKRTDNVLNKARNCGWELQVKKNEPVKANLEKVIKSLEEAS